MTKKLTGIEAVRESVKSMAALGREIGITRGAIAQWDEVPLNRVIAVSKATGLDPAVIRPDVFGEVA